MPGLKPPVALEGVGCDGHRLCGGQTHLPPMNSGLGQVT